MHEIASSIFIWHGVDRTRPARPLRFLEPGGKVRHVLSKATCELDANGHVEAVIGVFQDGDVTEFRFTV